LAAVNLRPALPADVEVLARELRAGDRAELVASTGADDPRAAIAESLHISVAPLAATDEAGGLVALFGIAPLGTILTPLGAPWLLGTDRVSRHAGILIKLSREYVARWQEQFPLLANFVDARNKASIRYLERVGFKFDPPAPFGAQGLPFHRFHLGFSDV
jgi:hypothetical protein